MNWIGNPVAWLLAVSTSAFLVAVETAATGIALLAAVLLFGRFRRDRRWSEWLLTFALLTIGGTNFCFLLAPELLVGRGLVEEAIWASVAGHLFSTAALVAGAWTRAWEVGPGALPGRGLLAAAVAALLAAAIAGLAAGTWLGPPVEADPEAMGGHPVLVLSQFPLALGFFAAAVGFARRARLEHDELLVWLAAGTSLAAVARLLYAANPSIYVRSVATGDVLRLGFYLVLLLGAAREIRAYWAGLADAAVAEERRRIARELHDGVAQELSYIIGRSRPAADEPEEDAAIRPIQAAALRGLDETRRAITALTSHGDETLDQALAATLGDLGARLDVAVELDLERGVRVSPSTREELLRIAREAVTNAGRHAHADRIVVRLRNGAAVGLVVEDDGIGFDPIAELPPDRFGLQSMRERAASLDASFRLRSRPGEGTRLEIVLPEEAR